MKTEIEPAGTSELFKTEIEPAGTSELFKTDAEPAETVEQLETDIVPAETIEQYKQAINDWNNWGAQKTEEYNTLLDNMSALNVHF